jgi:tight adherence protein B
VTARTAALEQAGITMRLQDVALLVIAGALVAGALGVVLVGPLVGLGLGLLVPILAKIAVSVLASRRQKAFADQLDDSLQLMASGLRAGHSLLQALNSVATEADEPTNVEFARVINETRVGREVGYALDETARRMKSDDFAWVTQAIAINREVGGNLAEVLDQVAHTIRERNQIRRQVRALSSEGRLSALVLMALPLGVLAFLSVTNPSYLSRFTEGLIGYGMIGATVLLMIIGALWLQKIVSFKF